MCLTSTGHQGEMPTAPHGHRPPGGEIKSSSRPRPERPRNSHIACIYAFASGPHALLGWATMWKQGDAPPWVAAILSRALARPLWKTAEQRAVRPFMRTEALAEFSFGIVAASVRAQIDVAACPYQLGASRPGGA